MTRSVSAVIDVGSNTIRLLVGHVSDRHVERVLDASEFVRLGRGVDATGEMQSDRMDAGVAAIRALAERARAQGVGTIRAVATSAVRDARNGEDFIGRVREETGIEIEIVSGNDEACLTYRGATIGVDVSAGVVVVDLGGGSAELINGNADGIQWALSTPLGSGRLTEQFIHEDPPSIAELDALRGHVRATLKGLPPASAGCLVCTGGTASHLGRLAGATGELQRLGMSEVERAVQLISLRSAAEIVTDYNFKPERAQVLPAGVAAIEAIGRFYGLDAIVITQQGIREGVLLEM